MTNANAAPASEPAIPNPRADIAQLDALERTLYCHRYAIDEIASLGPVIDPAKATAERGEAVGLLEQERVEALCAPEVGLLLDRIEQNPELMGQTRLAQARVIRRDRASLIDVPAEEQAAFTRLTTEANDVWRRAKAANDWASFEPYLDRIVEAMRHMAQAKNAEKDPYDVWLDEFEHGTSRAFYDPFFAQVKDCVVPLLADCMASRHKPDHKVMDGKFDVERQWALAGDLMRLEGVDEKLVRLLSLAAFLPCGDDDGLNGRVLGLTLEHLPIRVHPSHGSGRCSNPESSLAYESHNWRKHDGPYATGGCRSQSGKQLAKPVRFWLKTLASDSLIFSSSSEKRSLSSARASMPSVREGLESVTFMLSDMSRSIPRRHAAIVN